MPQDPRLDSYFASATGYKSASQIARVVFEPWVAATAFCPACGGSLVRAAANSPAEDFTCRECPEVFELKSKRDRLGPIISDGAYKTMMSRLADARNPNLFLLSYDNAARRVLDFLVIPKHFFVPDMIIRRPPLAPTARRAGWVGCNIRLSDVPSAGKVYYIRSSAPQPRPRVLDDWKKMLFLRKQKNANAKGWMLDILNCVEKLGKSEFTLADVYTFERTLQDKHPENRFVRDKIRQQLQVLRDHNYIQFLGHGRYIVGSA